MRRWLPALVAVLLLLPTAARAQERSLQEMLLRSKPAAAIVVAEVAGEVKLRCAGVDKTIAPTPYRESGTGFFLSPRGWLVTNGHVVFVAHEPPRRWLATHLIEKAFRADCLPDVLARRGLAPGARPEVEESLVREAVAATREAGAPLIWANARTTALGFYLRHGWQVAGEEFLASDTGLPHHPIRLDL